MLFSDHTREYYPNAPVHEVICQLRFPTILSINQNEPAEFQESIRDVFPQYARKQDVSPPRLSGLGTSNIKVEQPPSITNYHFLSPDGAWKLNLTRDFIALSTLRYPGWEDFAHYLDRPLASFIKLYNPAWFLRVGLRYRNIISRKRLNLEDMTWSDLIQSSYLGPLSEEDLDESRVTQYSCDLSMKLDSSCQAKVHAGPGLIKGKEVDPEIKFILDLDLFMSGNVPCTLAAASLETLHGHANRVFEGAVTDTLRDAMR